MSGHIISFIKLVQAFHLKAHVLTTGESSIVHLKISLLYTKYSENKGMTLFQIGKKSIHLAAHNS